MMTSVVASAFPKLMAAVEAMSRFEGPANGIRLNPKPVKKMIMNSIIDAIFAAHLFSCKIRRINLISASPQTSEQTGEHTATVTHLICKACLDRFKWKEFKYRRE